MDRTLHLVGVNSSEIFMLRYPRSVLNFCEYDLTYFAENAIKTCDEALKTGEPNFDRMTDLRNSLRGAHVYIEHNLRTIYDKIVIDCWIDYVCRRDSIGTGTLWNRFIACKTPFDKIVFARLSEYRYNKAINEWLNLVRVQDYAKNKIIFLFSKNIKDAQEAAARRNYFDLMFSVAAGELGCRNEELGLTQVFSVGRLPSASFMFPNISKDVIKNLLHDFDYSEDYSKNDIYGGLSDQIAMDVFSHIKSEINREFESYNISRSEMLNAPTKVYMPRGLKAAVDLEIDALIESGGWLARCKRCGRYFVRDEENTEEYCSLFNPGGKTCLEIYEIEHPKSLVTPELRALVAEITDYTYSRVETGLGLDEYEGWKNYLDAMVKKVENGEIPPEELKNFIEYSRTLDVSRSNPVSHVPKEPEPQPQRHEKVVRPFVPERVDRRVLLEQEAQAQKSAQPEPEEEAVPRREKPFFTSPTVQRQKQAERAPISHIIRGEQRAEGAYDYDSAPLSDLTQRAPQGFTQFAPSRSESDFTQFAPQSQPHETIPREPDFTQFAPQSQPHETIPREPDFTQFAPPQPQKQNDFSQFGAFAFDSREEQGAPYEQPAPPPAAPRQRIIRKNAAAISAYGKISGSVQPPEIPPQQVSAEAVPPSRPAAKPSPIVDTDPYKDVGAIFDNIELDGSENPVSPRVVPQENVPTEDGYMNDFADVRPSSARSRRKPDPAPSAENSIPSGIWTEERHLFPTEEEPEQEKSELTMLKEKKQGRSKAAQRLLDAIMREPDENPNFRKK